MCVSRFDLKIKFLSVDCWMQHRACIWVFWYTYDNLGQHLKGFNVWNLYYIVSEILILPHYTDCRIKTQIFSLVYYIETPHNEILWYSTHIVLFGSFCKTDTKFYIFWICKPWGTSHSFIYETPWWWASKVGCQLMKLGCDLPFLCI